MWCCFFVRPFLRHFCSGMPSYKMALTYLFAKCSLGAHYVNNYHAWVKTIVLIPQELPVSLWYDHARSARAAHQPGFVGKLRKDRKAVHRNLLDSTLKNERPVCRSHIATQNMPSMWVWHDVTGGSRSGVKPENPWNLCHIMMINDDCMIVNNCRVFVSARRRQWKILLRCCLQLLQ